MHKIFLVSLTACLFFSLSSCGYKEGVVQPGDKSYLVFTGNTRGIHVIIDDNVPFSAQATNENGSATHYQISPGKHSIVIKRDNETVLQREILIGNGMTKEINLP